MRQSGDGVPRSRSPVPSTSDRATRASDRYTFRGAFLDDVQDIIGKDLFEHAWDRMDAGGLARYGEALLAAGRRFAGEHGVGWVEGQYDPPSEDESLPESNAHIGFSAGQWCTW